MSPFLQVTCSSEKEISSEVDMESGCVLLPFLLITLQLHLPLSSEGNDGPS